MSKKYKILVAAVHYPVASGRYIQRAFKRLGHDVRTVGPSTGNQVWGMTVADKHVWTPDVIPTTGIQGNGEVVTDFSQVLPHLGDWTPDLVITADSAFTIGGNAPCPHVLWGVDNHVREYRIGIGTGIGKEDWDYKFLAHSQGNRTGDTNSVWLPCAYDPEYFTPSPIPMAEREYDVAMIGVMYERRAEILNAMMDAGLKVVAGTGALYEDYAKIYHNARISLCVSAAGDVAQRVFETAAMGCVILTDECADFGRLGFEKNKQTSIPFMNTMEAVGFAQQMLRNPETLQHRAGDARAWAQPHTWDARAQVVLDTMFGGK